MLPTVSTYRPPTEKMPRGCQFCCRCGWWRGFRLTVRRAPSVVAPALLPWWRSVGVSSVAIFRAFSWRSRRGRCLCSGVAFVWLVWAYFRAVCRVALRVACAVVVVARFFAPFSAFLSGGYMRTPPKRKCRLRRVFCPSRGLPLVPWIAAREKEKRQAVKLAAVRLFFFLC